MKYITKTIYLFIVLIFCTQNVLIMSMEHPQFTQFAPMPTFVSPVIHVSASSDSLSGIGGVLRNIADHPRVIVIIAAGCIILIAVHSLGNVIRENATKIAGALECEINSLADQLPFEIKAPVRVIVVPLKSIASFLCNGACNYMSYNKKYLAMTTIFTVLGYATGFPVTGALLGGSTFTYGAFNSRFDRVEEKMDGHHKEAMAQFAAVRDEATENAQNVMAKIAQEAARLSDDIGGLDIRIDRLGKEVNGNIQGVATQVTEMRDSLEGLKNQLTFLQDQLHKADKNNAQRDLKVEDLLDQLKSVSEKLEAAYSKINESRDEQVSQGFVLAAMKASIGTIAENQESNSSLLQAIREKQAKDSAFFNGMSKKQSDVDERLMRIEEKLTLLLLQKNPMQGAPMLILSETEKGSRERKDEDFIKESPKKHIPSSFKQSRSSELAHRLLNFNIDNIAKS